MLLPRNGYALLLHASYSVHAWHITAAAARLRIYSGVYSSTDLVNACGGPAGHRSPEHAVLGVHVHLHGGVAAGVNDLAPNHLGDGRLVALFGWTDV